MIDEAAEAADPDTSERNVMLAVCAQLHPPPPQQQTQNCDEFNLSGSNPRCLHLPENWWLFQSSLTTDIKAAVNFLGAYFFVSV